MEPGLWCSNRFANLGSHLDNNPWTLPSSQAVSMHAEFDYVLVQVNNECQVFAKDLVASAMQRYGIDDFKILGETKGQALENLVLQHPFMMSCKCQ